MNELTLSATRLTNSHSSAFPGSRIKWLLNWSVTQVRHYYIYNRLTKLRNYAGGVDSSGYLLCCTIDSEFAHSFARQVCECWKALARDSEVGSSIVNHLLEMFENQEASKVQPNPKQHKATINVAASEVLAVSAPSHNVVPFFTRKHRDWGNAWSKTILRTEHWADADEAFEQRFSLQCQLRHFSIAKALSNPYCAY